jgi:hypothetical protein
LGWRRSLALILLALALPTGWYAKNAAQYGFFGASSWMGMGLHHVILPQVKTTDLKPLHERGLIPDFYFHRSAYQHLPREYAEFGFDKTSPIPSLSRQDFFNINVPDISKQSAHADWVLIQHFPGRYLRAVHRSYQVFCGPPSTFGEFVNLNRWIWWEPFVTRVLYGQALTEEFAAAHRTDFGSMFYFYFPVLMLFAAVKAVRGWRGSRPRERARAWVLAWMAMTCLYVAVVGSMFEYGENNRFRFATEPMTWIILMLALRTLWRRWGPSVGAWLARDPMFSRKRPAR